MVLLKQGYFFEIFLKNLSLRAYYGIMEIVSSEREISRRRPAEQGK